MPANGFRPVPLANGLVYINPAMPGIRRFKRGDTFRYKDSNGAWVRDPEQLARIRRLAIPPAYKDVWICSLQNGHLQATGIDARGRKQYRYHNDWRVLKDETKFDRLAAFGRALPKIRRRVARDLRIEAKQPLHRNLVLATIVRLLDTTFLRVGNEAYATDNGSYGLTTLRNKHAEARGGTLKLRFRGKSGVMHEARVDDPRVAKVIRRCQQLPGQELFRYESEDGTPHSISSTDVNEYLREASGEEFTAKDFRTWHGTVEALEFLRLACDCGSKTQGEGLARVSIKEVLSSVASRLGNTPAVCKKAYVHPAVLEFAALLAANSEAMSQWAKFDQSAPSIRLLHAHETRLLAFLDQHRSGGLALSLERIGREVTGRGVERCAGDGRARNAKSPA